MPGLGYLKIIQIKAVMLIRYYLKKSLVVIVNGNFARKKAASVAQAEVAETEAAEAEVAVAVAQAQAQVAQAAEEAAEVERVARKIQ
jgi:hypothetical protein